MEIGPFVIDSSAITLFFDQPTFSLILDLFAIGGWTFFVGMLMFAGLNWFTDYRQDKFKADWKYRLLAIDIPQENVQTPKAVEQMFSHLAGALSTPDIKEKFWEGYKQRWFSFEIISIEGYIQFLIWTEEAFVDLVEAAMYAQYPDAEITEVEDYVDMIPERFPNDSHDIWIGDFGLAENFAFPIRSYREFEHSIAKDTVLKDPMGTFLESFTRIGPGEQMWFQMLVEPIGNSWKEDVIKKIKELIGEKAESKPGLFGPLTDNFITKEIGKSFEEINAQVTGSIRAEDGGDTKSDDGDKNQLRYLTPGQTKLVEAMEEKITKIGFKTKMRAAYIARKEVHNPRRGVNALVGAVNQFNIPSANSIVPTVTASNNKSKHLKRKNELIKAFRKRKMGTGGNPFVFNIEELATVWHFPMSHVKTPLIQKAATKTAEPPIGLPVESILGGVVDAGGGDTTEALEQSAPEYTTDSGEVIEYSEY